MFALEYSGLIIFLWIVCASLIGAVMLSFWTPSASLARTRAADRAARRAPERVPERAPLAGDTTARMAAAENQRRDRV